MRAEFSHDFLPLKYILLVYSFVAFFSRDSDGKVKGVSELIWSQIQFSNQGSVVPRTSPQCISGSHCNEHDVSVALIKFHVARPINKCFEVSKVSSIMSPTIPYLRE